MQKIIALKNYKEYKEGNTYSVDNNEAHSLIDGGYAVLLKDYKGYEDKMMRPRRKKWSRML